MQRRGRLLGPYFIQRRRSDPPADPTASRPCPFLKFPPSFSCLCWRCLWAPWHLKINAISSPVGKPAPALTLACCRSAAADSFLSSFPFLSFLSFLSSRETFFPVVPPFPCFRQCQNRPHSRFYIFPCHLFPFLPLPG